MDEDVPMKSGVPEQMDVMVIDPCVIYHGDIPDILGFSSYDWECSSVIPYVQIYSLYRHVKYPSDGRSRGNIDIK